jgi:hypothetical protein
VRLGAKPSGSLSKDWKKTMITRLTGLLAGAGLLLAAPVLAQQTPLPASNPAGQPPEAQKGAAPLGAEGSAPDVSPPASGGQQESPPETSEKRAVQPTEPPPASKMPRPQR